jgi:anti-sigma factor RsiW
MGDLASRLSETELAELSALADGTLPADRRAAVEARVAASPELQQLVERQRRAVTATRVLAAEQAPASLRDEVESRIRSRARERARTWRLAPRLALGGAVAAAAVVLVVALAGGPSGPSVADAARLASLPPSGPAPARLEGSRTELAARVDGAVFPDLLRSYGWRPVGLRNDRVDGRYATTVYYAKNGRRIAYVIVAGAGLPRPDASATSRGGIEFQALRVDGRTAVTWRRLGHTCVLIGAASRAELLSLASWGGGGSLRY